jgi:hypothetical protein
LIVPQSRPHAAAIIPDKGASKEYAMFVSHRADPEATVLDGLIDSVLSDPMYSAEPLEDPIRDYSDRVKLFLNDRTAFNVRQAVAS